MKDSVCLLLTVIKQKAEDLTRSWRQHKKYAVSLELRKTFGLRLIQTLSSFNEEMETNIWAELTVFIALLSQRDDKLLRHSSHEPNRIRI